MANRIGWTLTADTGDGPPWREQPCDESCFSDPTFPKLYLHSQEARTKSACPIFLLYNAPPPQSRPLAYSREIQSSKLLTPQRGGIVAPQCESVGVRMLLTRWECAYRGETPLPRWNKLSSTLTSTVTVTQMPRKLLIKEKKKKKTSTSYSGTLIGRWDMWLIVVAIKSLSWGFKWVF